MLSAEQFVAIMGALTALIVATTAAVVQLRQTHGIVNSRMTELVELTRKASFAEGKLAGSVGESPTELTGTAPQTGPRSGESI